MFRTWLNKQTKKIQDKTWGVIEYGLKSKPSDNFTIIGGAVFDNQLHRFTEFLPGRIHSLSHVLPQRLQIHGPGDDLVVILYHLGIHWCVEGISLRKNN